MTETVSIRKLFEQPEAYLNQTVRVVGWSKTIRDQKQFAFLDLTDGSGFQPIQIVCTPQQVACFDQVVKAGNGAAFIVVGQVVKAPQGKRPIEIQATEITVEGSCPPDYPLQPKRHSVEFLRTLPHLRMRTNLFQAVFRVRSEAAYALHHFFHERGFLYLHSPILTTNDCEGAGEMFRVSTLNFEEIPFNEAGKPDFTQDFFGKSVHLTVSGQLHGETFAQAFTNIYTFGPTFRAEHSNTQRHAAEFWMIEPEMAFADLKDVMAVSKDMLQFVLKHLLKHCRQELEFFDQFIEKGLIRRLETVAEADFVEITYTDAIDLLKKADQPFKYPVEWGLDLQTEHERYLTEQVFQKPVFVTDYPKAIKAFYMRENDDGKTVAAVDCLVPGVGEIIGGSQREERYDRLLARIQALGLPQEAYQWYLDLRRFGSTRHGGFGLGFERLLMYVTGVSNIRDVIAYPRTTGQAEF